MSKPPTDRFSPDGSLAYVANNGSPSLSVIDTASSSVLLTIEGITQQFGDPSGVAVSADGNGVYVTNVAETTVSVLTLAPFAASTP